MSVIDMMGVVLTQECGGNATETRGVNILKGRVGAEWVERGLMARTPENI